MIKISKNPDKNWANNQIQFPRLIAEMESAGLFADDNLGILATEMGLSVSDVALIIGRAQIEWDSIKEKIK